MKAALLSGVLLAVSAMAMAGGEDAVKKEMKLLEGEWQMQAFESNGVPIAEEQAKGVTLTIKGDRYVVDLGAQTFEMTFKIDPTKKPKTMDLTMAKGDEKSVTLGIYELSGDTFRLCRSLQAGGARPTEFVTKEGSGLAMATYKRKGK